MSHGHPSIALIVRADSDVSAVRDTGARQSAAQFFGSPRACK